MILVIIGDYLPIIGFIGLLYCYYWIYHILLQHYYCCESLLLLLDLPSGDLTVRY